MLEETVKRLRVYPNLTPLGFVQRGWVFALVSTALILQLCDERAQVCLVWFFLICTSILLALLVARNSLDMNVKR